MRLSARPRLDLLKIDAEWAELLVLEGMRATRERFPQTAIVLELHLPRDPENAGRLLSAIQHEGYALQAIHYTGQVVPTTETIILARPEEHWTLWLAI